MVEQIRRGICRASVREAATVGWSTCDANPQRLDVSGLHNVRLLSFLVLKTASAVADPSASDIILQLSS